MHALRHRSPVRLGSANRPLLAFIALVALSVSFPNLASSSDDKPDAASLEAIDQTKKMLKDPQKRQKAIQESPDAQQAGAQVDQLAGNEANREKMYGLSAKVFEELAHKAGGDPMKINELLQKAMKSPEEFYKSLSPEAQAEIKSLSGEIKNAPTMTPSKPASPAKK